MKQYDVFKESPDGSKTWVCAVATLDEAKILLEDQISDGPFKFYVCDLMAKRVLAASTPAYPDLHQVRHSTFFRDLQSA